MNIGFLALNAFSLIVVVMITVALPEISRPTVPLGVSVPSARVKAPAVIAAIRRYRTGCLIAGGVALAGTIATFAWPILSVAWLLAYGAASTVIFVVCRRPIIAAKQAQGWYDGVEVRVSAPVTPEPKTVRVPWVLYAFAAALVVAAIVVLLIAYPKVPDPMPVHWNGAGVADRFEPKNPWGLLWPTLFGLGMVIGMGALGWAMSRRRDPQLPDGNPRLTSGITAANAQSVQTMLGWVTLLIGVTFAVVSVLPVVSASPGVLAGVIWTLVAASLVPCIWLVVATARRQRVAREQAPASGPESPDHPYASGPESPDDDRYWKLGFIYYNPADPRAFVPKRNGVGLDANAGHPVGMALYVFSVLVLVGTIVLVVVGLL